MLIIDGLNPVEFTTNINILEWYLELPENSLSYVELNTLKYMTEKAKTNTLGRKLVKY